MMDPISQLHLINLVQWVVMMVMEVQIFRLWRRK